MALVESSVLAEAIATAVADSNAAPYELDGGLAAVTVSAASVAAVLTYLRDHEVYSFKMFLDVTAIDQEASRGELELVYSLRSMTGHGRVAIKAVVNAADPRIATVSDVFKGANWGEREVYDMFGVTFEGHPNLSRILMYEEFEGYPLRKTYPYDKRQPLVPERDPINDPWPKRYT